jgi:4-amino-4-deoxy-L-arabinose transferase-like glycosyltransferase
MLLVAGLAAIMLLTNLGGPRLWDDDESRNAGCAREMLLRGDWIVPTFNAELRAHKPVLTYWCMLVAYKIGGASELTARLPSALASIGTVLLTYCIGRRLFNARVGLWAAIALSCSLTFCMIGRAATPDGLLVFTVTLSIALYVFGTFARRTVLASDGKGSDGKASDKTGEAQGELCDQLGPLLRAKGHWFPQRPTLVVIMYAAMALAVLTKGPVGLVLPVAVIGMFLLIQRLPDLKTDVDQDDEAGEIRQTIVPDWLYNAVRPFGPFHFLRTCWSMWPLTAIVLTLLIAGPWYVAVGWQTEGEFLRGFFVQHNFERATRSLENHHGFPGFYVAMLIAGFFPWSVFALPVVIETSRRIARKDPWAPSYLFAVCWIGVYVLLFSVARTKLINYIAPCFPAAALLVGAFVDRWLSDKLLIARWWPMVAFAALALVGVGLTGGTYLVADKFLPGEQFLGLIGLLPIFAGVIALFRTLLNFDRRWTVGIMTGCSVAMTTLIFALGAQRIDAHRHDQLLVKDIQAHDAQPKLATYFVLEPSWVYYSKQPIVELPKLDPAADQRPKPGKAVVARMNAVKQVAQFLSKDPSAYVIMKQEHYDRLKDSLPADVTIVATRPLFDPMKDIKLIAVGRAKAAASTPVDLNAPGKIVAQTPGETTSPKR